MAYLERVLAWNAKVGRKPTDVMAGLETLIESNDPDVVALQEFKGYVGQLRDRFAGKWWIYAHNDWPEANDNPVMVSHAFGQKHRGGEDGWNTLRTETEWTGPQGGDHQGRTWTWVKVAGVFVLSLHRCTDGNGRNSEAFTEEARHLTKWIRNHTPAVVIGDHNCGKGADFPGASRLVATDVGGRIKGIEDVPVDYALEHGIKGTAKVLNGHGSDHRAIKWVRS